MVTSSCSQVVDRSTFVSVLREAAFDNRQGVRVLGVRGAAPDHPWPLGESEGDYLKCVFLEADRAHVGQAAAKQAPEREAASRAVGESGSAFLPPLQASPRVSTAPLANSSRGV